MVSTINTAAKYYGISSDTKPVDARNGSTFVEMDTSTTYMFSASDTTWYEIGASEQTQESPDDPGENENGGNSDD